MKPIALVLLALGWAAVPTAAQPARPAPRHWAFRPVVRPRIPRTHGLAQTPVDRFILAALEGRGLTLSPEADPLTLLRRVSFDLTGLPPSPEEMDAFLADHSPDAYERLVERYLGSPHYGERWGKFWLDAAGYADSNGYFSADSDRPLAWRYRDYVIAAWNADKPYDRFVTEQLAGDELAGYRPGADVTPAMAELLIATHFLRNAPDGTGESDGNPDEVRTDRFSVLEGTLQINLNCLLGLTIQCARCHRHKFEPITHQEYYRLEAIFFPAYNPERWKPPKERVVQVGRQADLAAWKRRSALIDQQIKALKESLAAAAGPFRDQLLDERLAGPLQDRRLAALEPGRRDQVIRAVKTPKEKRTPAQAALLQPYADLITIRDDDLARRFPEFAAVSDRVAQAVAAREKERGPPPPALAVLVETDPNPPVHHVLRRGQHNQPGEPVEPGVPAVLCQGGNTYQVPPRPAGQVSSGRRLALARWMTAPENPLLARVLVNRLWQHHFGRGLVATPDNLGQSGARPTHPELLDYLASELVRDGWSIKALHRLILHSAVYRQASTPGPADRADPENHLLGRFPLRRLDAEALRDALLAVAGELDGRAGGPPVPTRQVEGVVDVPADRDGARRRSVYLQQRRTQVPTLLQLFDAPSIAMTCSVRPTSTVPLQALSLLNSEFVRARARGLAARLEREAGAAEGARVTLAFRLACGRPPLLEEADAARRFLARQRQVYGHGADNRPWIDLGQMVLASNAFLYVE